MKNQKIIHNRIRCKKCGDIIESFSEHDFKWCSCQSCAVDGGHDYLRRLGWQDDWEEMSETIPLDFKENLLKEIENKKELVIKSDRNAVYMIDVDIIKNFLN